MGILNIPVIVGYVDYVQRQLEHVQTHGGEAAVTRIEGYLTQYETQQTALVSNASNAGVIKADVVEFALGGFNAGTKSEMTRLRKLIATSLSLTHMTPGFSVRLVRY